MRAIEISRPGLPEVLRPVDRPDAQPGPGEVLLRVAAAGVNRPDLLQRRGGYAPPPGASDIPGLEVAGTIVSVHGAERWQVGDRVTALLAGGGYAELCAVPAEQCLPVPRGLSLVEAAALPETFFTVWANIFESGRLQKGETLLVHGGAGGIGTTAIQLGKAFGAVVIATAGSDEKCRACLDLGAAHAVNYKTDDFVARVREFTSGRGADVILDIIGGEYLPRNLEALAMDGRLVQIGLMGGGRAQLDLGLVMRKRLIITGSLLRPRTPAEKGRIARGLEEHVWPLIESGAVRPVVHATFPLERAADAHALLESSAHVGKVVLTVSAP